MSREQATFVYIYESSVCAPEVTVLYSSGFALAGIYEHIRCGAGLSGACLPGLLTHKVLVSKKRIRDRQK
jgi:hypothetical protein